MRLRYLLGCLLAASLMLGSCGGARLAEEGRTVEPTPQGKRIFRIAFGSCNRSARSQVYWDTIAAFRPNVWLWLGDIVYADTKDMGELRTAFELQKAVPRYRSFAASRRVLGVWDDHDFGSNNLDGNVPQKEIRQEILLDFLDEPRTSPRRTQEGIYAAYDFAAHGTEIRLILLDLRYFRNVPPHSGNLLGATQWRWLESQLRASPADLNLIASSTQVLREDTGKDTWAEWPEERARLFDLIASSGARNVVILSGDLHAAELARKTLEGYAGPLYEITSSGLTHARSRWFFSLTNRYREALYLGRNFGLLDLLQTKAGVVLYARIFDFDGSVQIARSMPLR